MAKARMKASAAPDHLTMQLFAPGMTALHRAGLGGLACTLKYIERAREQGILQDKDLPGGCRENDDPPWSIDEQSITLRFDKPENAERFLKRLFRIAFQTTKNGLIYLPGQYADEPSQAVLADLQSGLTLTFLQHGKVRQLAKDPTTASYDPLGDGVPGVVVTFRRCASFKHQDGWEELIGKHGCVASTPRRIDGPISPGTVVRHVAFTGDTGAEDTAERLLPLYFAMVGCIALPLNRSVAALIVPEVDDLLKFIILRPLMTPTSAKECQIANAADGALQMQLRLRNKVYVRNFGLPGCYAMTFMPTAWASQQKSRVSTIVVQPGDEIRLDRFEVRTVIVAPENPDSQSPRDVRTRKEQADDNP